MGSAATAWALVAAAAALQLAALLASAASTKGVHLAFPRFTSAINCSLDGSSGVSNPRDVCTPSAEGDRVFFSFDDGVISARYQYKKRVQLWKRGSKYAASFSTSYTVEFRRSSDRVEAGNYFSFGGGWAFAITPDQRVGGSGPESFGLFEIDDSTGRSLRGRATKTVAVELDISRRSTAQTFDDPQIPHVGLDVNSVQSVVSAPLGNFTTLVDRRIAVFVDYDAPRERLEVRVQKLGPGANVNKAKAKLYISRPRFRLADYVAEQSYVGFSSRVPETEDGTYVLYDWKFDTKWALVHS